MHVGIVVVAVCIGLGALSGCPRNGADHRIEPIKPQRSPDLTVDSRLVKASNDFGFRLYRELAKTDAARNIFISPTSIELALAMTYNGAGGTTKDAMAETLGLQAMTLDEVNEANAEVITFLQNPDPKVELAIANSLWGRQDITFNADFLQRNRDHYDAEVRSIDFGSPLSSDTINRWVSEKTRGRIPGIVDGADLENAFLLLLNALYFKGEWTVRFKEKLTQDGPFTLLDGTQKILPMMRLTERFEYLETDEFQAISLPYGDEYVRMLIFLPKAGTALADFTARLTNNNWDAWIEQFEKLRGTIVLPRFQTEYSVSLKDVLTGLGMGVAFTADADLSGMFPQGVSPFPGAWISDVKHSTLLDVNEEGTVAAAVTKVRNVPAAPPPVFFTMTVDHPFFLTIQDRPTGAILFMGTIVDPQ